MSIEEKREKILSTIWQADVLDQTRLRPLGTSVNPIPNKNLTAQAESKTMDRKIVSQVSNDKRTRMLARTLHFVKQKVFLKHDRSSRRVVAEIEHRQRMDVLFWLLGYSFRDLPCK